MKQITADARYVEESYMAYTKTEWKDRTVENARTFTMTENDDGTVTLEEAPGEVYEAGTPLNAENMNHIEDGIEQLNSDLTDLIVVQTVYYSKSFSVDSGGTLWLDIPKPTITGYSYLGMRRFGCGGTGLAINEVSYGMRVNNPRSYKIDVSANKAYIEYVFVRSTSLEVLDS